MEPKPSGLELRIIGPSLQTLGKAMDVGILFIDARSRVEYATASACELLGVPDEARINEIWPRLLGDLQRAGNAGSEPPADVSVVVSLAMPSGATRRLRVRVRRIGGGHLVTLRDLALIDALGRDVRLAGRYRNLTRIHAAAAHDLKGALNTISLTLQVQKRLLQRLATPDQETIQSCVKFTDTLIAESQRLGKLTQDLLVHSVEAPEVEHEFDLRQCVEEFATVITPLCMEHDISFQLSTPAVPVLVSGRRERFKQALMNLALNAVDALAGAQGLVAAEVRVDQGQAVFTLTDTGPGIPEQLLDRIWALHFTTKRGGSGIGLHVVQMVVKDHGGTVRAWNRPEGGCAFEIRIPLAARSA